MKTACLDSVTLIYFFKEILPERSYSDYDREMSRRAKYLLHYLRTEEFSILAPTVVVNEYLAGVDVMNHASTLSAFQENFEIPPFDLKTAAIAASLWRARNKLPVDELACRRIIKSDVMIIATAKAFGATHYYSNDKFSIKIAELAGLRAFELPEKSPYLLPDAVSPPKPKKTKKSFPPLL